MDHNRSIDLLNRLFQVYHRSMPVYVEGTRPWTPPGDRKALETLSAVAAEDRQTAQRIAEAIQQAGGRLDPGQFPTAFTDIHDLSAEFLCQRAAELLKRDLETTQSIAAELAGVPHLRQLADETLQQARRHLEMLAWRMMSGE